MAVCAVAWLVPGGGHLWLGRRLTGGLLLVALPAMYGIGLVLGGEVFAIDVAQPLAALSGLANLGVGWPNLAARLAGWGTGDVVAATYEFGNTFLVVSGLLNALVVIDAFDVAMGRK